MQPTPILYETHMHTPLCRHAVGQPEEYAAVAARRGMKGIVVTCHTPLPNGVAKWARMYPEQWPEYVGMVERAREACAGWCDVRLGLECDYMPGLEGFLKRQLESAEFHHVLGSIHPLEEFLQQYDTGDQFALQKTYFDHLALSAECGLFDTLSHPDLIKNITAKEWNLERILPTIEAALDRIAATGVAMELNTSGVLKVIKEMNPGPEMLRAMCVRNIPVVIGSDAHRPDRVGDGWEAAMDMLENAGYTEMSYFLNRKRFSVAITDARASLIPN